jgi:hypothetical protein
MSGSSFNICGTSGRRVDAIFDCTGPLVYLYFALNGKAVGERLCVTRGEAAAMGSDIATTGEWRPEFPTIGDLSTDSVRAFGERLKAYGINGC